MRKVLNGLVPPMLGACETSARRDAASLIAQAAETASLRLDRELERLEALAKVNPAVRESDVQALRDERDAVMAALPGSRPRLDALRLITSPDFLLLRR
jgi:ATP-dependent helicase HepA